MSHGYESSWGEVGTRGGGNNSVYGQIADRSFGVWGAFGASTTGWAPNSGVTRGSGGYTYQQFRSGQNYMIKIVAGPNGNIGKQATPDQMTAIAADINKSRGSWNPVGTDDPPGKGVAASLAPTSAVVNRHPKNKELMSLVGTAAGEDSAINNIIKTYQTGDKKAGAVAVAGAVARHGPGMAEAAGDFLRSKKDNPKVLARKLAKAKVQCKKFKARGNKAKTRKWCQKVEMYRQMLAQLQGSGAPSMEDMSPALENVEAPGLPTWAPWAIGGSLLLVVGFAALSK